MRNHMWLMVLVFLTGLACTREKSQEAQRAPAAKQTSFTLKVTFEGLVGYVNKDKLVWALLPKAQADTSPWGYDPSEHLDFPEHYAVLKVNGENVKNFGLSTDLQIPIDGKEIQVSDDFADTGYGILPDKFRQKPTYNDVDMLDSNVLSSAYAKLAARVKLPLLSNEADWIIEEAEKPNEPPRDFVDVYPVKSGNFCKAPGRSTVEDPRVQAVTWQKKILAGEVALRFKTLGGTGLPPLVLMPAGGKDTIQVWIFNKEWQALYDPDYHPPHWPAYRWFYNLSVQPDCTKHYYPQGDAGGNRCPQKLYSE